MSFTIAILRRAQKELSDLPPRTLHSGTRRHQKACGGTEAEWIEKAGRTQRMADQSWPLSCGL